MPRAASTTKAATTKVAKAKQPKVAKEPKAPKEKRATSPSAYIIFTQAKRADMKAQNPTATFAEMGKLLGSTWSNMTEAEKAPYQKQAAAAKAALGK